jgi:hypothetical protein
MGAVLFLGVVLGVGLTATTARADVTQACIDASDKGQTLRIDKKLREAREQFVACAQRECPSEVRDKCSQWLDEAQRAIPSIVFAVKDGAGNDVRAVRIAIDGVVVREKYDGTALQVDPGEHTFRFEAGAAPPLERTFRLVQGEHDRQERIVLAPPGASSGPTDGRSDTNADAAPSGTLRSAGLVIAGVGLAGIAVGSVFGALAISENADAHCDAQNVCARPQSRRDAQARATVSTIGFATGGVLLAGGVVLFLTAPRATEGKSAHAKLTPMIALRPNGVALGATW